MPGWRPDCFRGSVYEPEPIRYRPAPNGNSTPDKDEEISGTTIVELHKKEGSGLGLIIAGGVDKGCPAQISSLKPGGIAYRSDALEVGDTIVSVNDIKTDGMRHDEIINLLKNSGNKVSLEVEYHLPDNSFSDAFSVCCKQHVITLEREGNSFGFTVRGGYCPFQNKTRPLIVTQIRPGGSADREGLMKIGDRLLAVNDYSLAHFTLLEVTKFIQQADQEAMFTVEYDVSVMEAVKNASGPLLVEIDKTPGVTLGIALIQSSYQGKRCLCISDIQPMSIADRCGALHIGDHILTVDGASVEHMSVAEVTQLMRSNVEGVVKLEMLPVNVIKQKSSREALSGFLNGQASFPSISSTVSSPAIPSSLSTPGFSTFRTMGSTMSALPFGSSNTKLSARKRGMRPSDRKPASCMSLSSVATSVTFNNQVCHSETVDVVLYGDSRGTGITVDGGGGLGDPPMVTSVYPSSPAEKCGLIKEGDRILTLNGQDTSDRLTEDVNQILQECRRRCDLVIEFDVTESVMATSGIFIVKLPAHGGGLGISITASSKRKLNEPLIVSDVKRGGLAYRCGSIQSGDKLLSVNDVRTDNMSADEALHLLQTADEIIKLRLKRDDPFTDDSGEDCVTYTVELKRHGGPLGITISGTDVHTDPIIISNIIEGGLAERTGAIHIGDRLLGINGESMKGRNLTESTNLLKNAGDLVTLKIARPSETSKTKGKRSQMTERDETATPVASGDSAMESWDSCGQDVIVDASGHTHPIVVGRPVMKKKFSTSGYQSQDSKTKISECSDNHSEDTDSEWDNFSNSSDGNSCHSNNVSSEDAAEWSKALRVYENQSDLLQQIGASLRQRSTASLDRRSRQTASLDRSSRPSENLRRQKFRNIAHSTARSALSEDELQNIYKTRKSKSDNGIKPNSKEDVLTMNSPAPIQLQKIKLTRNSLDEDFGFGLSDGMYEKGLYVSGVKKGSIADKSGLKQFDRILQLNGKRTRDFDCHLALPLISEAKIQLELIICRNPIAQSDRNGKKKIKKSAVNQPFREHNSLDERVHYTNIQVIKGSNTPKSI